MKIIKNRIFLAVLCVLISGGLILAYVQSTTSDDITVYALTSDASQGTQITSSMIESITVSSNDMDNAITSEDDIVSKFASIDMIEGQIIIANTLSDSQDIDLEGFDRLVDGEYVAFTIAVDSVSASVADKLLAGDIVTVHVIDNGESVVPDELKYIEILNVTTESGLEKTENSEESATTITFIVTPEQAEVLHYYEYNSTVHLSLIYRGEDETKQTLLDEQTKMLSQLEEN